VTTPRPVTLPSRHLGPAILDALKSLGVGDRVRITQTVRVGAKTWPAVATGVFRGVNYLSTGVTTERGRDDAVVVPTVHFTKASGELSSVTLDEHTRIEKL